MDYFYNNPEALASQQGYDENAVQGLDSSSSSYSPQVCSIHPGSISQEATEVTSPTYQVLDPTFQYVNTNTALYPETNQNWLPLELDNLIAYDETQLEFMQPEDSSSQSPDGEKENPQNTKLRRRAQNRASQRAFRERKDRHLKGLEYQLENLGEKHHDLMQSYMKQSESVMKLNSRLAELRGQIGAIKSHGPNGGGGGGGGSACSSRSRSGSGSGSFSTGNGDGSNGDRNNSISQNAESFDAFSSFLFSSSPLQRLSPLDEREDPFWQDMTPRPSDPDDVLDENGLPPFEDLLQLK